MESSEWSLESSPSLSGKTAIVTGANSGLGFETSKVFAAKGATVIMACRNMDKAAEAKNLILSDYPDAIIKIMEIDLSSLDSVRAFASKFNLEYSHLDILMNNAGVMMPPYTVTNDGFELQYEANYLGHFLLTGLLLRKLENADSPRVVSMTSLAHEWGDIYFKDMQFTRKYDKRKSYGQSKLALLIFAYELERRLRKSGSKIQSLVAHPGIADTNLARYLPPFLKFIKPLIVPFITQKPVDGAQSEIRAALDRSLPGGSFIGPNGPDQYKGSPVVVDSNEKSKDEAVAKHLWSVSEKDAGIEYLDSVDSFRTETPQV